MVAEVAAAAGPAEAVQCVHVAPAVAAEVVAVAADPGDGAAGAKSHDLAVTPSNVLWPRLRYVAPPRSNTLRLIQKVLAIASRCFCVLIDGDDDRLHMLIAPAFPGRETTSFFESP